MSKLIRGEGVEKADELHLYMDSLSIMYEIDNDIIDSCPAQTCDDTWDEIENPRINVKTGKTRIMTVCPNFLSYEYAKELFIHSDKIIYKLTEVSDN